MPAPLDPAASGTSGHSSRAQKHRRGIPTWLEIPLTLVAALLLALLLKTFLVQIFYIPSGSMEDTLMIGDRVAVNRLEYRIDEPQRGDVVVFDGVGSFIPEELAPAGEDPISAFLSEVGRTLGLIPPPDTVFVKRVIGVGGDRVTCCDDQGRLLVNGQPLDEPYLYPGDVPSMTPFDVLVPDGALWMMGDHRSASADSRSHLGDPGGGMVPVDRAIGKVFAKIWPFDRWGSVQ